jgi:hypothetical protein
MLRFLQKDRVVLDCNFILKKNCMSSFLIFRIYEPQHLHMT